MGKQLSYGDLLIALSFGQSFGRTPKPLAGSAMCDRLAKANLEFNTRQQEAADQDEDEDDEEPIDDDNDDAEHELDFEQVKARSEREDRQRDWYSSSALVYLPKEDADHYRGLAQRFELLSHVPLWEHFERRRRGR